MMSVVISSTVLEISQWFCFCKARVNHKIHWDGFGPMSRRHLPWFRDQSGQSLWSRAARWRPPAVREISGSKAANCTKPHQTFIKQMPWGHQPLNYVVGLWEDLTQLLESFLVQFLTQAPARSAWSWCFKDLLLWDVCVEVCWLTSFTLSSKAPCFLVLIPSVLGFVFLFAMQLMRWFHHDQSFQPHVAKWATFRFRFEGSRFWKGRSMVASLINICVICDSMIVNQCFPLDPLFWIRIDEDKGFALHGMFVAQEKWFVCSWVTCATIVSTLPPSTNDCGLRVLLFWLRRKHMTLFRSVWDTSHEGCQNPMWTWRNLSV